MADFKTMSRLWTNLRLAALVALVIHLIAGFSMALILRHGLETNPDFTSRLEFLAHQTPMWILGWLTWTAAALSILYFYASFARAHESDGNLPSAPLQFAVLLSVAGIAADLAAETIEMGVLPGLAERALMEQSDQSTESSVALLFLTAHRSAVILTGFLANGLYSLSAMLLVWTTRSFYARWIRIAGLCVGLVGLALSGASLVNSVNGMFWTNVVLVPSIIVWQLGVAITASKRRLGRPPADRQPFEREHT